MNDRIYIKGAKEHNLKNIELSIPKNRLAVVTGLSGSGKSSLAFDTVYAEGQRRYVESLSSYARQFLEQLQKPDVEHIEGLSPAIAIEQRTAGASPRSIVATQTELYDYLRLLFARVGHPHCPSCGRAVQKQTSEEIIDHILSFPSGNKIYLLAPVVRGKKGEYQQLFPRLLKEGFSRVRIDGKIYGLDEQIRLKKYHRHTIEIVVDRLKVAPEYQRRISDAVEVALRYSRGMVQVYDETRSREFLMNARYSCPSCGISLGELEPRMFSFNSPYGACPACNGLGNKQEFDTDLIVPEPHRTLREGAIEVWRRGSRGYIMYYRSLLRDLADEAGFSMDVPFSRLAPATRQLILYGSENVEVWGRPYEGVIPHLERLLKKTDSEYMKTEITKYMSKLPCPECEGARLRPESLAVYVNRKSIWDVIQMSIDDAHQFFSGLRLSEYERHIAQHVIKEVQKRLAFCVNVGLGYLNLNRLSSTLSGGEAQRIRLATQLGSSLSGVIYILDEPTIGLHPRDDAKLIRTLRNLRDLGNTLLVVEHDEQMIRAADWIVDLGPGAGNHGGTVVFSGDQTALKKGRTLTAAYLHGRREIPTPPQRRAPRRNYQIEIIRASEHNLKNIRVVFPLGVFLCVTGVSGSGKSTLVEDILYKSLARKIYGSRVKPGAHSSIKGAEYVDKVIIVDQSPIGRTPRSNPATYTGVFTYIREVFARLPEAKARGYRPARFSFNVSGGRCDACRGDGTKKIEMHFLPDVYVDCEICGGTRFNKQTLEITFKGKTIADVLSMTVDEAFRLFENFPRIKRILETIRDVGLGYITLGQAATTLSGGEAQRMKLASQLRKRSTGQTFYILDEPTTGLHFHDVKKLLEVLQRLVEKGNTVLLIEHNLDVIKCADYVIDLGPEGGASGGKVIAAGTPEEITRVRESYTGRFLKAKLLPSEKKRRKK
ncbi:MAG: excinuclease ABC subunit UvrA [Candidatus Omnitrophica bacterium]|nr:excinuclease ABC subunit UvrA [Candidatus Omnitrophota bacterium]